MFIKNDFNRFQFDNHIIFHQQIRKVFADKVSSVVYLDGGFCFNFETFILQFYYHRVIVDSLQKTISKRWINPFVERVQDRLGNFGVFENYLIQEDSPPFFEDARIARVLKPLGACTTRAGVYLEENLFTKEHAESAKKKKSIFGFNTLGLKVLSAFSALVRVPLDFVMASNALLRFIV